MATKTPSKGKSSRLLQMQRLFESMPPKSRRAFVNAFVSDQGPENPKLGNRADSLRSPTPPTSGSGAREWDYFRDRQEPGQNLPSAPAESITPARVALSVRMRWNPVKGLTPERAVSFLDQFRFGFFRMAATMWDQMQRRDYQLRITEPKRKKSVARHGYEVLTVENLEDGQQALAEQQKDFLQHFYDNLSVTTALDPDEEGGMSLLLRQMMDAQLKYYAVHEIVWQPGADGYLTAKFIFCPLWWFEGTRGKLRFLDSEFQVYGRDMRPGEWLVTCGDGLMECITVIYVLKWLGLKSWISLLDKFGQPGVHGKTDAVKGSKEWNDFVEAMQQFAQEWSAVTNRNAEIALIEAKSSVSGNGPFDPLIEKLDRAITQLMRGGDLGTSSGKNRQGASLQEDETEILETDDAKMLEETLMTKVSRYALAWKFGPDAPQLVYVKLRTTPRRNLQDDIAVDEFLLGAGAPLSKQATLERYNRPIPRDGDELLVPVLPGQGAGPGGKPVPPDKTDANPEFANDAMDAAGKGLLLEAIMMEFRGINQRLEAIGKIDDAEMQRAKLSDLLADLETLKANLDHDPAVAQAIYKILAAGVGNGIAKAAKSRGGAQ